MAQINKGTTFSTSNSLVTIANLNALVDSATLAPGSIAEQPIMGGVANPATDLVNILQSGFLKSATVDQATGGVLANATDGDLLIGSTNSTRLAKAKLTAGANIAITNGSSSITIATRPSGSYSAPAAYSGTQTVNLPDSTALTAFFKYSLSASAAITVKLSGGSKIGDVFRFKITFLGSATINFQASGITTNIVTATAASGTQEFTFISLQDYPTLPAHWGYF